jgi:NitT/TauT family transport system ATP-binding protein
MEPIIKLTNVSKIYDNKDLGLSEVNLSINKGDFVALIGPSGCGKSTLLKLIAGFEKPTTGEVLRPDKVSMVFQNGALLPWLSVEENVLLGARAYSKKEETAERRTDEEISMIGLANFADKYPRDLSGGQRQRVGIARALSVDPKVLLLDEPFSAIDPKTTEELHRDITAIWQRTGSTIVMVTHLIEEAVGLADRIILMNNFKISKEYQIGLPHPRREDGESYIKEVQKIRKAFFAS